MAGQHPPSIDSFGRSREESKGILGVEESHIKFSISVASTTVLIKDGQAKVLGDSIPPCIELTGERHTLQDHLPTKSEVVDCNDITRLESELIDLDYFCSSDSSSEGADEEDKPLDDPGPVANTLKLLEEINYRVLGEKPAIPKIESVEDLLQDDEEKIQEIPDEDHEEMCPKYFEYLDVVRYSEKFTDVILQTSKQVCKYKHDQKVVAVTFGESERPHTICWPTAEHFSVEVGIRSIDGYLHSCFTLAEAWTHRTTHLLTQSDKMSDFYFFEAKFCIPTVSYPIAQATVSVYFTFEVCRIIPKKVPVRVTFTVESLRTVMVPGENVVNDEVLLRVLYSKLAVFQQVNF